MRTIHLVSHTHWDREWYLTFQQFRLRLVHLVDGLLELLANDPEFKHFMLDGQTIVLDDYLRIRPEAEPRLRRLIRTGRVLIGPWHILPDMFLVGPEAHIRNLLEGRRQTTRFGREMTIGYMPDSFGHIGQMPQILQGFGIDNACLWRGVGDQPTEFWWQAPDGSRVLMLYLRDSYSNGAALNAGLCDQFIEQLKQAADSLASHSAVPDILVMYGTDHMEPPPGTSTAIRCANDQLRSYRVIHSTLPTYLSQVQAELKRRGSELPIVIGELRSSERIHLLPGTLSTRMWIKQRNQACESLLEQWAEPFSTFASLAAVDGRVPFRLQEPSSILHAAWYMLMECHPHDSICGCSVDQVHEEMKPRFDQVQQIGEELTRQSLEALADTVNTMNASPSTGHVSAIVVFNPSSTPRTDVVTVEVSLPPDVSEFEIVDEQGSVIPHQSATGRAVDSIGVSVRRDELGGLLAMVHQGRVGNLAIQQLHFERDGATVHVDSIVAENAEPDMKVWENALEAMRGYLDDPSIEIFDIHGRSPESAAISFVAAGVPGLGWKSFYIRRSQGKPLEMRVTPLVRLVAPLVDSRLGQRILAQLARPASKRRHIIENEILSVEVKSDGTLTVTDKTTGTIYRGLNHFVDGGDCGDTYNFCPLPADRIQDRARLVGITILPGPVQHKMVISLLMRVPESLSEDRKSRSKRIVEIPITSTITLTKGVPRVDVHTRVNNRAKDHRLRVLFPAPFAVDQASYDGHFETVKRPLGVRPFDSNWAEEPRPEAPERAFTSVSDGQNTLTIANRGLPEVEVLRGPQADDAPHSEIAITLLRCVGWLSRDDFATRHGHAGPFLETPKAQMPGEWEFDYSIIPSGDPVAGFQQAHNFQINLRASTAGLHSGTLPPTGSFVYVDNPSFLVTAIKQAEDGRGWIVRGYNDTDRDITVTLTPWRRFNRTERTNLAEETMSKLEAAKNGEVKIAARGHEIVTVLFGE